MLNDSIVDIMTMAAATNITYIGCATPIKARYPSTIGIDLAIPQWQAILLTLILSFIIMVTIIGNTLVILSVFTYKPLRIVQNFFIVSLAVADLTVAILVLPFNVVNMIIGRWEFGINLCKMWLTSDVLCCTSSILNLCAIALDRYWAITDPINYAQKRTVERVLILIAGVWILSLVISSPPLIGWNDWPKKFDSRKHPCVLNSNPGYRIYSALGSFFIPLVIMSIVYVEIYIATRRRLRERARASRINPTACMRTATGTTSTKETGSTLQDPESMSSETNHNELPDLRVYAKSAEKARRREKLNKTLNKIETMNKENLLHTIVHEDSITDMQDLSSESNKQGSDTTTTVANDNNGGQRKPELNVIAAEKQMRKNSVYQFIEEKQKISLSKERRAARTLGIIMGVFVLCWVPFFLVYIVIPFCPTCCPSNELMDFLTWLGYLNSALNPIIYTIFNLDYRRAFKKLLGIKL